MRENAYRGWTERLAVIALIVAAGVTMAPLLPWLVLSLWVAALGKPLLRRIKRRVGGSERAAALLVIALFIVVVGPLIVVVGSLSKDALDLANRLVASEGGKAALEALVSGGSHADAARDDVLDSARLIELAEEHGARAWTVLTAVTGAAANLLVGLFIFFTGTYVALVDGDAACAWFMRTAPVRPAVIARITTAFLQTGRGLFIGTGLTGLAQATIATMTYVILGVPNALVLGLLTFFVSILPTFGTALIWAPVATGLALTDRTGAAVAMTVVGVGIIGVVDNLLRPFLAHWADNHLPTFVVMVGMFGGIAVFGGWGILLGPLLLRLGMEGLAIAGETRSAELVAANPASEAAVASRGPR